MLTIVHFSGTQCAHMVCPYGADFRMSFFMCRTLLVHRQKDETFNKENKYRIKSKPDGQRP